MERLPEPNEYYGMTNDGTLFLVDYTDVISYLIANPDATAKEAINFCVNEYNINH